MADVPGGLRRFDARLDAHLRRRLSPEDHDRVSTSVKSVASLTGDIQHKHRYVILGYIYREGGVLNIAAVCMYREGGVLNIAASVHV